jgi:GTP-dependent phosphoenolpyruvate carboxykinase
LAAPAALAKALPLIEFIRHSDSYGSEKNLATPLEAWVEEAARRTRPKQVVWCDGSEGEAQRMAEKLIAEGRTVRLNEETYPNCILHRSDPSDVARQRGRRADQQLDGAGRGQEERRRAV